MKPHTLFEPKFQERKVKVLIKKMVQTKNLGKGPSDFFQYLFLKKKHKTKKGRGIFISFPKRGKTICFKHIP